jgi:hypothetical protein
LAGRIRISALFAHRGKDHDRRDASSDVRQREYPARQVIAARLPRKGERRKVVILERSRRIVTEHGSALEGR